MMPEKRLFGKKEEEKETKQRREEELIFLFLRASIDCSDLMGWGWKEKGKWAIVPIGKRKVLGPLSSPIQNCYCQKFRGSMVHGGVAPAPLLNTPNEIIQFSSSLLKSL